MQIYKFINLICLKVLLLSAWKLDRRFWRAEKGMVLPTFLSSLKKKKKKSFKAGTIKRLSPR